MYRLILPRIVAIASKCRKICRIPMVVVAMGVLASAAIAGIALFKVYRNNTGTMQTQSSNDTTLNETNPFFDASIGTNGQACVTCHQPSQGITITVPFIQGQFATTGGTDPLFRPNDTANNPSTPLSSHTADNYSVFLALGTPRIGELVQQAATPNDFTVVADAATNAKFAAPDMFPLTTDPQHPGVPTLSIFRRPLVNVNVNFDSSVLWDGRADISKLNTQQVPGAIKTLLLGTNTGPNPTFTQQTADAIRDFMTGVYVDQKSDNAAKELDAAGATGGVNNLLALSQSASRPCVFDEDTPADITPFVEAVATPTSCTPVVGGGPNFTMFQAWENLGPNGDVNMARLSIARGEKIFNTTIDFVGGHCTSCHSTPNLGNNPSPAFMVREGHDSIAKLTAIKTVAATSGDANATEEAQRIQDMIDRVALLPAYCLRPTSDTSGTTCGTDPGDAVTTDPARALVTGKIADLGKQKPPTLRDLSIRAPFFHNGDAVDMQHLVTFYKFFLKGDFLTMTPTDEQDLINFLNAL
jgi:cytochrome c peroxidase